MYFHDGFSKNAQLKTMTFHTLVFRRYKCRRCSNSLLQVPSPFW